MQCSYGFCLGIARCRRHALTLFLVTVALAPADYSVIIGVQGSKVWKVRQPTRPPEGPVAPTGTPTQNPSPKTNRYRALPAAPSHYASSTRNSRNFHDYLHLLDVVSHIHWTRLGMYLDLHTLLVASGVEVNPGPVQKQTQHKLTIAHININSITTVTKIDELNQFVQANDVKVLALSETKLDDTVDSSLYKIKDFHAPMTRNRNRHGGGVAIYVPASLPFQRMTQLETNDVEGVWAKIKTTRFTLMICCTYIPPHSTAEQLQHFSDHLTDSVCQAQIYNPTATVICGDLNTGNIYLDHHKYNHNGITSFDRLIKDTTETLDLTQLIKQPTRIANNCENLRDLIYTSNTNIVTDCGTLSPFAQLDHFPVYVTLNITFTENTSHIHRQIWDYSKLNAPLLTRTLLETDWANMLNQDIETATNSIISTILDAATASIPVKHKLIQNQKGWVTPDLKRNIRKRERLFKIAKRTQTN